MRIRMIIITKTTIINYRHYHNFYYHHQHPAHVIYFLFYSELFLSNTLYHTQCSLSNLSYYAVRCFYRTHISKSQYIQHFMNMKARSNQSIPIQLSFKRRIGFINQTYRSIFAENKFHSFDFYLGNKLV